MFLQRWPSCKSLYTLCWLEMGCIFFRVRAACVFRGVWLRLATATMDLSIWIYSTFSWYGSFFPAPSTKTAEMLSKMQDGIVQRLLARQAQFRGVHMFISLVETSCLDSLEFRAVCVWFHYSQTNALSPQAVINRPVSNSLHITAGKPWLLWKYAHDLWLMAFDRLL